MPRKIVIGVAALVAALVVPLASHAPLAQTATAPATSTNARVIARVIVKYKADASLLRQQAQAATSGRLTALRAQALGARIGLALAGGAEISERSHVVTASGLTSRQLAMRLAADGDIEYAVPDERMHIVALPNDPFYTTQPYNNPAMPTAGGPLVGQWYLKPPATTGQPASINAEQAWDTTIGSASIVVADLDTGVRFDHFDLLTVAAGGNLLPGYDMVAADSDGSFVSANDGDGRDADASDPGDWVTQAESMGGPLNGCDVSSSSWHGTRTAGLIGAITNNLTGIASVGRTVRVLPVRVLGKCGGFTSDIVAGILWSSGIAVPGLPANPNKARVINMSLGGDGACSAAYIDAIGQATAAGVTVVVSAGNTAGRAVAQPANCPNVIAVGGLRHVGTKVGFSDVGLEVAISAPGGNCVTTTGGPCQFPIMTTSNTGTTVPATNIIDDSFNISVGTSFSSPLVVGTAALMLSVKPTLTPADVKFRLQFGARPFPTSGGTAGIAQCMPPASNDQLECYCTKTTCGAGMLDARASVLAASGVQAQIAVTTANPAPGEVVVVASTSVIGAGQTASYQWSIVDAGTTGATITGATDGTSVTVQTQAAGTFTVQLRTTDNAGIVSTASAAVVVAAPTPPPPEPSSDGGGGGGALGVGWLLLLIAAAVALELEARRARRREFA